MNVFVLNYFFFGFSTFLISLLIFMKRGDEISRRWFYFSIFVTLWAIFYAIEVDNKNSNELALYAARIANSCSAFIPLTWLYFLYAFLEIKNGKMIWIIMCSLSYFLLLSAPTSMFIPGVSPAKNFAHISEPGLIFHIHTVYFFCMVGFGFYLSIRRYLSESEINRKREIGSLCLATAMGFTGGASNYSIIYFRDKGIDLTFLLSSYPFLMAYAMTKQKLFDVEKLAQAAHQSKLEMMGILSASINHELRNPLYIIKNFAETLAIGTREGAYPDPDVLKTKLLDHMDRIVKQSNKAMKIIGRLTAFARKKPDQDFKMEPVSLKTLLEDLDILIRCEIEFHKIQITQEIPEDLPSVFADPAHLEEILLNLILNAYQVLKGYQTEAQKEIRISACVIPAYEPGSIQKSGFPASPARLAVAPAKRAGGRVKARNDKDGGKIQITIRDNGPGISPEDLPNIFKPFYTKKQEGLGLGLYITKQLIEKNRGSIKIESKPGLGAAFVMEFEQAPNL